MGVGADANVAVFNWRHLGSAKHFSTSSTLHKVSNIHYSLGYFSCLAVYKIIVTTALFVMERPHCLVEGRLITEKVFYYKNLKNALSTDPCILVAQFYSIHRRKRPVDL